MYELKSNYLINFYKSMYFNNKIVLYIYIYIYIFLITFIINLTQQSLKYLRLE